MLNFAIDNYKLLENNKYIMIFEADVVCDGPNYHNTYFSVESIIDANASLSNIPIICIFDKLSEDFEEHARTNYDVQNRIIVGSVPESNQSEIVEINGKKWQRLKFIIWKLYTPECIIERFLENSDVKISMEIDPIETQKMSNDLLEIKKYNYVGISLLGDKYTAAIPGADAKVIKYSMPEFTEISAEYNNIFQFSTKKYSIPNEVKCEFQNLKNRNPKLISFSNLIKINDEISYSDILDLNSNLKSEEYQNTKIWCDKVINYAGPHHVIRDNELVVDKTGVEASGARLNQTKSEGQLDDEKLAHVNKHRKELDMDKLEKFAMNYVDLMNMAHEKIMDEKGSDEYGMPNYFVVNADPEYVYCNYANKYVAFPYSVEDEKVNMDFAGEKKVVVSTKYTIVEKEETDEEEKEEESMIPYSKIIEMAKEDKKKLNESEDKLKETKGKLDEKESENEELKKFKSDVEKKEKQEEADTLYATYDGFITDDDKKQFNEILFSVENFDIFKEKISAIILPKVYAYNNSIKNNDKKSNNNKSTLEFNYTPVVVDTKSKDLDDDSFEKLKKM